MKNYGYPIKRKEVEIIISEIDTSGDGELDFEDFLTVMMKQIQNKNEIDYDDHEMV